jgi:LysR family glycine cleavage system transcriptional activator
LIAKKKVQLTTAGEIYYQEIQAVLKQIANVTLKLKSNPEGGTLNLAILPTFGTRWLASRLTDFLSKNSGVTVNLSTRLILPIGLYAYASSIDLS